MVENIISKNRIVRSWCVKIIGQERINNITNLIHNNGYQLVDEHGHYPNYDVIKTVDRVFVRKDFKNKWRSSFTQ